MTMKRLLLLVAVLAITPLLVGADAEADVKDAFVAFQAAIKARDVEKLWPLLDTSSQKAVEKAATALAAEHAKATDTGKTQLEGMFGLTAEEIGKLNAMPQLYCKSKRFLKQWGEVPGSQITGVDVRDDKATVKYTETDGDKEKLELSKQDGKWKIVLSKSP
jgi:hypothetical protein